jgi:arginyl-tRNA synthetase
VLIADLDRALTAAVAALVEGGTLPASAAAAGTGATWRADSGGNPATFASSLAFELATQSGCDSAVVAAALASHLRQLPWVAMVGPPGDGYLNITVTVQALAASAARQAAAGNAAALSTILEGTTTTIESWPDPAAAPSWRRAWQDHTAAMTSRLALAAGAGVSVEANTTAERGPLPDAPFVPQPTAAAVAWFGASSVRYRMARTASGQVAQLARQLRPGGREPDPLYQVRHAHAHAASTLRWAAELTLDTTDPGRPAGELLGRPAERQLLGLLPWLPVRVASAARRHRPDVLPAYLEQVADAWLACWQAAPALPFGGRAAPRDAATTGARLLLPGAVRAVLAAGLVLTGAEVHSAGSEQHG